MISAEKLIGLRYCALRIKNRITGYPYFSATSRTVKKLPSDFDIFVLFTLI